MAVNSMTGFAREAGATGALSWAWELKSVNGRGLEVRVRVPPGFDAAGEDARRQIAAAFSRGQCQLTLTLAPASSSPQLRVSRDALQALLGAIAAMKLPDDIRPASLDGLLSVRGVVEIEDGGAVRGDDETLRRDLSAAPGRLVAALAAARASEGAALHAVLQGQLAEIGRLVEAAETCPARQPDAVRARLAEQVAALLAASAALDPGRLHQEAALLATRADIREELDRLKAHVEAARELLAADGPVGRRLDFLAQEFGREANTLCSKANDVSLSRIGLELKAVVEQFREQVQNVE
ncbi:YicC/YloC family endoribonuclease [Enterovirga aerilata]|uniref:YicC family protein n=1 Tax=Enterovirga aerilata TaxID=2730920 RepID=A0A849HZU9_9HYPH|nr:YicC/YloC family endoribonuclease [Enterovirga sp. DB1703]NNM72612.1 YicC family protein [Enterovirga sp. DB1703]